MAVPNVSEGREAATVRAISRAFSAAGETVRLLDVHSDSDHHRSVYALAGPAGALSDALLAGAGEAVARIDVMAAVPGAAGAQTRGEHPHVGALDVAPIVYLDLPSRGAAFAEALVVADRIGDELSVPVFLYGELAGGRTRAQLRSGGVAGLARRIAAGELVPDFGPPRLHPSAGASLVCARAPLVAFNLQLAPPASVDDARRIASVIREGGAEGLPGVRAIGVELNRQGVGPAGEVSSGPAGDTSGPSRMPAERAGSSPVAQVSLNVERPYEVPLAQVVERVRAHARVTSAELVGLAPSAALAGFPEEVPLPGFDPERHLIERALGLESQLSERDR